LAAIPLDPEDAPAHDGLGELLGLEYLELGPDVARARVPVTDAVRQPLGLVHGGAFSVLVEGMCSRATYEAVRGDARFATGQAVSVSFLRPISAGHVNATARARHRGATTWVWDVEITDDDDRLCALARMTVAVRPR
jgi:1,4-dihydroxy-2-naphthoyl-CoA hydrolase